MDKKGLKQLLEQMTLDEKIGQLQQLNSEFFGKDSNEVTGPTVLDSGLSQEQIYLCGSVLGISGAAETRRIQEDYLAKSRLRIPLLFMADIIHGFRTIFPISLGLACSFNPLLAEKTAAIAAKEAATSGLHVTFAPMVDLVRDPRWGRVMESTGEDPYLNSVYAKAFVQGFQGESLISDHTKVAACVKHFAAYGAAEGGRDYNTVNMSERELRNTYMPAYLSAIEAQCKLVMTAFNIIDGIPSTVNKKLLRDYLREEIKFDGVVISDWGAVKESIPHGVAEDEQVAAQLALEASCDIEMMTFCYFHSLKKLILEEKLSIELLDEAVLRILTLKNELGLFENPYRTTLSESETIFAQEHRELALHAAEESIVLLKNEQRSLPLDLTKRTLFAGTHIDTHDLLGAWSWQGQLEETKSLKDVFIGEPNIQFYQTREAHTIHADEQQQILAISQDLEQIVVAVGETSLMSGEAKSYSQIRLSQTQEQLIIELARLGKKVIVVIFAGRPLDLSIIKEHCAAIVYAWFPGTEGAQAVANILSGKINPSGKLSMSFPQNVGQIPVYYNHFMTGRPAINRTEEYVSKYMDIPNEPLFPFGYGLSYTSFGYSHFKLEQSLITEQQAIAASVTIKNTGKFEGQEIVQVYVRDVVGEVVRPVKELVYFEKIRLLPQEEKIVRFTIKLEQLGYVHTDLSKSVDSGEFELFVGGNSQDVLKLGFIVK